MQIQGSLRGNDSIIFFSPHGESKIIYKFLAVLAQLEILQL